MRRLAIYLVALSSIFLLVGCGNNDEELKETNNNATNDAVAENVNDDETSHAADNNALEAIVVSDEEKVADDKVVVKVNDQEILGSDYNLIYLQAKTHLRDTGLDPKNQALAKELTMGSIIEQELIKWDASKEGIEVTDDEVQTALENAQAENGEELDAYLEEFQLTEADYKNRLHFAMIHEAYLAEVIDAPEVTDEEVEEVYELLKENDSDFPELDAVKPQLKMELNYQKEIEQLQIKMAELQMAADIEEMI